MSDINKFLVATLFILAFFAVATSFVLDANSANGNQYDTNYPTLAKVQQYSSFYSNASTNFREQVTANSIQNQGSNNFFNLLYGLQYGVNIAAISVQAFIDISVSMVNDATAYFGIVPAVIALMIVVYLIFQLIRSIANVLKGGPL